MSSRLAVLAAAMVAFWPMASSRAQGTDPQHPAKEYIRLGGRVIAIENAVPFAISVTGRAVIGPAETAQLTAANDGGCTVNWSAAPVGAITATGHTATFTAPGTVTVTTPVTVTGACGAASAQATLTVNPVLLPEGQSFGASGGTGTIVVTRAGAWTAAANDGWIHISSGASGTDNGTVAYSVDANAGAQRNGTLTVAGIVFAVSQSASSGSVTFTPTTVNFLANGSPTGTSTITVTAPTGFSWSAVPQSQWIHVSPTGSQTGSGTFSVTVDTNAGADTRSGFVNVSGTTAQLTVNQAGQPTSISISPTSVQVSASGGGGTITVTADPGFVWRVDNYAPSWIGTSSGGTGNGTVTYSVNSNGGGPRTGLVYIGNNLHQEIFTVTQGSGTVEIVPGYVELYGSQIQNFTINISGVQQPPENFTWTLTPNKGTIDWSGYYVAPDPATITAETIVTLRASRIGHEEELWDTATIKLKPLLYGNEYDVTVVPPESWHGGIISSQVLVFAPPFRPVSVLQHYNQAEFLFTHNALAPDGQPSSLANSCYIQWNIETDPDHVNLADDSGNFPTQRIYENSQCRIWDYPYPPLGLETAPGGYERYTVRKTVQFKDAFAGSALLLGKTNEGFLGGYLWETIGTWNLEGYQPPTVFLDAPLANATVANTVDAQNCAGAPNSSCVPIIGWALDNTGKAETAISAVEVYVDNTKVGDATYGLSRGDVCAVYPDRPGCSNVGFRYAWDSTQVANGQHVIRVVATDSDPTPHTSFTEITVTVNNPVTVAVSPKTASLTVSQTVALTATVTAAADKSVTWSLNPNVGQISTGGVYTAPSTITTQQVVRATATSTADNTKSDYADITLVPVSISLAPASASLTASQVQAFTATVTGGSNPGVNWTLDPNVGTLASQTTTNGDNQYTAPATIGSQATVTLRATSIADPSRSATAQITLVPPVVVTVSPSATELHDGGTRQFAATVTGAGNTAVTWSITPSVGTIGAAGLYSAPASITSQQAVVVRATSQADGSASGTATVTLMPPVAVSVSPTTATLYGSQTQQLTATVVNTGNTAVTWSLSPNVGTISPAGLYTAPASISSQQPVSATATSQADPSKSAQATIALMPPVEVTVSPSAATLNVSQTQQFTATVINATDTAVTWSLSPNVGSITAGGLYTAPASIVSQQTVTVTATSHADNMKTASATVTLVPVSVSISPTSATRFASQTQQFSATVTGTSNTAVTWSASEGSVNGSGLYTAPALIATQHDITVTATSQADGNKAASATVTLLPVAVSVSPSSATLNVSQTQQFTATVTNTTDTAVTWSLSPNVGSINGAGLYAAPSTIGSQQTVTVTAASHADGTKTASATVTLVPVSVSISPTSATRFASQTQQFTATVTGTGNTAVTWSASEGTVNSSGLYTAPGLIATQHDITVTATSQADANKAASATVTLLPVVVSVSPSSATLNVSQTQQFTTTVTNTTDTAVTWSLSPNVGSINGVGLYTAPSTINSQQTVTVTATSHADGTKTASATVTLVPVSVSVSPTSATRYASQTQQFTSTVSGTGNTAVTWSTSEGTISASGLYTAPGLILSQHTATVTATSQVDVNKSASATVTLVPVAVSVAPTSATLSVSQTQQFTATVINTGNPAVTWSINPSVGTISQSGLYTAPETISSQQTVTVIATSQADPSKSATATVTLEAGLLAKVGSFARPTSVGSQAITGVGFQPKVVLFWMNMASQDGSNANAQWSFGWASSSSSRFYSASSAMNNQQYGPSPHIRYTQDKTIGSVALGTTAVSSEADLVSMDADGFTLNWSIVHTNAAVVNYLALGGADLTGIYSGQGLSPSASGNVSYSGIGFRPDSIIFVNPGYTYAPPALTFMSATPGIGFTAGPGKDGTSNACFTAGYGTYSHQRTAGAVASGCGSRYAALSSLDADGFTLNWPTQGDAGLRFFYLALKGARFGVGSLTQRTSVGSQSITGTGFRPKALILSSVNRPSSPSFVDDGANLSVGAGTSSTARFSLYVGGAPVRPTSVSQNLDRTKIIKMFAPNGSSPTLNAAADLTSMDSNGFTLNWTTTDSVARQILYWVIGPAQ